jgi:hypothetical protein
MPATSKAAKAKESARHHRNHLLRRRAIDAIKLAAGCADCGYNHFPEALQFDHIPERGPKLFNVANRTNRRWSLVLAEIEKCEVVCANCHAVRTWRTRRNHGS